MFSCHKAKRVEHAELFWIILKGKKMLAGKRIKKYRVVAIVKDKNNHSLK
jgi:hypothetical protein